jgi:transcriptional regulator with XRE-family HTH domain
MGTTTALEIEMEKNNFIRSHRKTSGRKKQLMELAFRLRKDGWSKRRIARELGVSENTIYRWLGSEPFYYNRVKRIPIKQLSEFDKGWVSALIDGEGCIRIELRTRVNGYAQGFSLSPSIQVTNNCLEFLLALNEKLGVCCSTYLQKYTNPKHKTTYHWQLKGVYQVKSLLEQITPYLIVKRKQAELVLEYCLSRLDGLMKLTAQCPYTEREIELAEEVWKLNAGKRHTFWNNPYKDRRRV